MDPKQDEFFQLKADLVPLTVLKITTPIVEGISKQLQQTIKKAPKYFHLAPVLVDVSGLTTQHTLNLEELIQTLRNDKLIPVAIRGLNEEEKAEELGLALLKKAPETQEKKAQTNQTKQKSTPFATKIITKPVRAGTQVYAKNSDLIITAAVNPGAECFADGSIHVYGPLRGRALAGVNGDSNARIFCKSLEAELIAIAGVYEIKENINPPTSNDGMVQVYLENNKLQINTI